MHCFRKHSWCLGHSIFDEIRNFYCQSAAFSWKQCRVQISNLPITICRSTLSFLRSLKEFLGNSKIKTFLLLKFLSSRKSASVYISCTTIHLYLTTKSVTLYTIFQHFGPRTPMGELTVFPHTHQLLELRTYYSRITSDKIIRVLQCIHTFCEIYVF